MINPLKRSMVFIDGSNLNKAWKRQRKEAKSSLDYEKLMLLATQGTDCIRGYFYDSVNENDNIERFLDALRNIGITVVTKPLRYKDVRCERCNTIDRRVPYQKGIDIALSTDLLMLAYENVYDVAIIISGDNDFVPAIEQVKRKGKIVRIVSFGSSLGQDLRRSADKVIQLDGRFPELERKV